MIPTSKKPRLYGKRKPKLPKPTSARNDKGFSLRVIGELDGRFNAVKAMRQRVQQLMDDCGADTVQKEWLCGRAVYLLSYIETLETESMESKDGKMKWRDYFQAVRALSDVLKALGLHKAVATAKTLEGYVFDQRKHKPTKSR